LFKRKRPILLDVIPTNDKHPADAQTVETSAKRLLNFLFRVEPPPEHPIAQNEVEFARSEVVTQVLQAVDDMILPAVPPPAWIHINCPIVRGFLKSPIVAFCVPVAANEQHLSVLLHAQKVRKYDLLQNSPIFISQVRVNSN
jgi:hypothetical protein